MRKVRSDRRFADSPKVKAQKAVRLARCRRCVRRAGDYAGERDIRVEPDARLTTVHEDDQQLAQRTKTAEDAIAQAKTRALTELRGVGAAVTGNVLGKVAGLNLPPAQVQAAVDAALSER